jgi:cytochrome c biogenesis protein CcmG/thiol:disulfide interchange protein DsbE
MDEVLKEDPMGAETQPKRRRWGVVAAWVSVIGLLVLLGFGLGRAHRGPITVGDQVPDFVLITFDGQRIDSQDLRGQVVLLNFWASWCTTCKDEAFELEQAFQMYRDRGVVFLGIDYADSEPEALAYLERFAITYPNGPDLRGRISQSFRVRSVPETYIVGPDGILTETKIGPFLSLEEIVQAINQALGEP